MELLSWPFTLELITIVAVLLWYTAGKYRYWSSRGIPGPTPIPLLGNIHSRMFKSLSYLQMEWKQKYGSRLYGYYTNFNPVLVVQDPELIKQIMVKDFHLFVNRKVQPVYHKIWNNNLFVLEDDKWKAVRSITSPTFTSGKLRGMHHIMNRSVDKLVNYLGRVSSVAGEPDRRSFDVKQVIGGFTMDVIASTSFATETNTNDDCERKSPFLDNAYRFFKVNVFKLVIINTFPKFFLDLFNCHILFHEETFNYFANLSKEILKQRTANPNSKRNDLVQLLLDSSVDEKELAKSDYSKLTANIEQEKPADGAKHEDVSHGHGSIKRKLTENEIIAQCILFILAGYETTASTISCLIYEMSLNQDVQERLFNELNESLNGVTDPNSEEFYHTVINRIPYLEATIKETLRKYPPVSRVERRVSVAGYKLGGVELYKEQLVEVPVYAIHHSEEFYPEPERFNPERFMPENKEQLTPYTYLPFGTGPRNCVGMRFAYQEIKLAISQLITRYRFEPCSETPIPLKFRTGASLLDVGPFSVSISSR